jgi:hypothetical protein
MKKEKISKKALGRQIEESISLMMTNLNLEPSKKASKLIKKQANKLASTLRSKVKPIPSIVLPQPQV